MFKGLFTRITSQKPHIYAIIYLLLIPIFALLFCFLPGLEIKYTENSPKIIQSIYFSVVTITTLGYGDITPQNSYAQLLAASEAIFGVVVIGLFLNSLSHNLSLLSQEAEKRKEIHKRYKDEVLKLQGYDRLVQLNIDYYLKYTIPVTTPISDRISDRNSEKVNRDFSFNDMQDLFKTTLKFTDNQFKPAINYYFKSQVELQASVKELICNVNVRYWSDLEELCLNFLRNCKTLDFSEHILNQPNTCLGDKKGSEFDEEMIKNHTGEVKSLKSNAINPYVALFYLIKGNLEFIDKYQAQVSEIVKGSERR
ncbi:MAG: potassium channel family protein [Microcoleus sp.]